MRDIRKKIQSDNDTIENLLNKTFLVDMQDRIQIKRK